MQLTLALGANPARGARAAASARTERTINH